MQSDVAHRGREPVERVEAYGAPIAAAACRIAHFGEAQTPNARSEERGQLARLRVPVDRRDAAQLVFRSRDRIEQRRRIGSIDAGLDSDGMARADVIEHRQRLLHVRGRRRVRGFERRKKCARGREDMDMSVAHDSGEIRHRPRP